jgi:excisionase family DNA binding protein
MEKKLLDSREVSALTGLPLSRIYELSRKGQIPLLKIGERQYRYPLMEIENWLRIPKNKLDSEVKIDA